MSSVSEDPINDAHMVREAGSRTESPNKGLKGPSLNEMHSVPFTMRDQLLPAESLLCVLAYLLPCWSWLNSMMWPAMSLSCRLG